jgi:hypothetical protein
VFGCGKHQIQGAEADERCQECIPPGLVEYRRHGKIQAGALGAARWGRRGYGGDRLRIGEHRADIEYVEDQQEDAVQ